MTDARSIGTAVLSFLVLLMVATPAGAQGVERLGDFTDWSAFRFEENGQPACYIASQPKKDEGKYTKRGKIYAIVTHRPAEKRVGEISFKAGYTYKKDSAVKVAVDKKSWTLFTDGENAWAPSPEEDRALVKAMRAGSRMVVKGTSSRGTATTDTYSLLGFSKAYAAIGQACGL
jgi:hypothetical protein